jgi:hypothetical protein
VFLAVAQEIFRWGDERWGKPTVISRERLFERTGIRVHQVSDSIAALRTKGLLMTRRDPKSRQLTFQIPKSGTYPNQVPQTVDQPANLPESGTSAIPESGTSVGTRIGYTFNEVREVSWKEADLTGHQKSGHQLLGEYRQELRRRQAAGQPPPPASSMLPGSDSDERAALEETA